MSVQRSAIEAVLDQNRINWRPAPKPNSRPSFALNGGQEIIFLGISGPQGGIGHDGRLVMVFDTNGKPARTKWDLILQCSHAVLLESAGQKRGQTLQRIVRLKIAWLDSGEGRVYFSKTTKKQVFPLTV